MKDLNALLYSRGGSHVTRYHSVPTIRQTNIAEHSFNVANVALFLTGGAVSARLLKAALHHDIAEITTGDVPAPVKKNATIKEELDFIENGIHQEHGFIQHIDLTEEEAQILKLADCFEGLLYTMEEYDMGNKHITIVLLRWIGYITELPIPRTAEGPTAELLNYVTEWTGAAGIEIEAK